MVQILISWHPECHRCLVDGSVGAILAGRGDSDVEVSTIPNVPRQNLDLDDLQEEARLNADFRVTNPGFRTTPMNEFNRSQPLLSPAFPSLYPNAPQISPSDVCERSSTLIISNISSSTKIDDLHDILAGVTWSSTLT